MNKKTLQLYLLFSLLSTIGFGQSFYQARVDRFQLESIDTYRYENEVLATSVIQPLDSIYSNNSRSFTTYQTSKGLVVLTDCFLDTYFVESRKFNKQSNRFSSFNCDNYLFERDNTLNLVVNNENSSSPIDILQFDSISSYWKPLSTKNKPALTALTNYIQTSTGIWALPQVYNNLSNTKDKISTGYFLDWESKEWRELELKYDSKYLSFFNQSDSSPSFETADYFVTFLSPTSTGIFWNVIDKETGEIYRIETPKKALLRSPIYEVAANTIYFQNIAGQLDSLEIEPSMASAIEIGQILSPNPTESSQASFNLTKEPEIIFSIGLGILILVGLSFIFYGAVNSTSKQPSKPINNNIENYIFRLQKQNGNTLSTKELDEILDVTQLENIESQRIKRSRMINEINKRYRETYGKELIDRLRITNDRRYISYLITS
jgi:hypothetical protein